MLRLMLAYSGRREEILSRLLSRLFTGALSKANLFHVHTFVLCPPHENRAFSSAHQITLLKNPQPNIMRAAPSTTRDPTCSCSPTKRMRTISHTRAARQSTKSTWTSATATSSNMCRPVCSVWYRSRLRNRRPIL